MIREKRELFRVQIRRKKNEQIFIKKRNNYIQSFGIDFPQHDLVQLISKSNLPQCLENLDQYLSSKKDMDTQIINSIIPGAQVVFDVLLNHPQECSQFLTNFTYHMNRQQMLELLNQSQIINLNILLNRNSDELKENLSKILCNFIVELKSDETLKLANNLQLLTNIYYSYNTHGYHEELSMNYLRIIAHLFFNNYNENNMEQILEIIDNISQSTIDDNLKLQSFKTMRAIIGSAYINQFEIVNQFNKFIIIDDALSIFNKMIQIQTASKLGIQALKMFNIMIEKNKQLMKLLLEKYHLLTYYCNALQSNLSFNKTITKLIYQGFQQIIEDDNNFALKEQHLCFEKIVIQVQIANKNNQEFPSNICQLIIQLLKSRYKSQTIIEFPILKLINEFYQKKNSIINIDDYLFVALTVLKIGEMIYPKRYVAEFLKNQGESIIQDIQKNTNEYSDNQIIDEIIKITEYDENFEIYN